MLRRLLTTIVCVIAWAGGTTGVVADDRILLTVVNERINGGNGEITFTEAELEALEWRVIRTKTEFTDGENEFAGPRIAAILDLIGRAGATTVEMVAANDYAVEIAIEEILQYDAIAAMEMDGQRLSLRDKGPLWVMYPLDDFGELRDPAYNSRLIWQLTTMVLK